MGCAPAKKQEVKSGQDKNDKKGKSILDHII